MEQSSDFEGIKKYSINKGADLFGICDLDPLEDHKTIPKNLLEDYTNGIVIGLNLGQEIFDKLPESRSIYGQIYKISNRKLDSISFDISRIIRNKRYKALQIPASKDLENTFHRSYISHKAIAREAGLGWIGKSLLFINENYGPRVRLASVLTDMPFDIENKPMKSKCGECTQCIDSCIVEALKESDFSDYPKERNCFDVEKCAQKLKEFESDPEIGKSVCGICIKACPVGRSRGEEK